MVQFRFGRPDKSGYRRFKIRGYQGPNDPGMIHDAVSRRIQHLGNETLELPDLIVIDGGPTQLSRAMEAAANFDADVKIVSLAKRFRRYTLLLQKNRCGSRRAPLLLNLCRISGTRPTVLPSHTTGSCGIKNSHLRSLITSLILEKRQGKLYLNILNLSGILPMLILMS